MRHRWNLKFDKVTYHDHKAQDAQRAADIENMEALYDIARELSWGEMKEAGSLKVNC